MKNHKNHCLLWWQQNVMAILLFKNFTKILNTLGQPFYSGVDRYRAISLEPLLPWDFYFMIHEFTKNFFPKFRGHEPVKNQSLEKILHELMD